MSVDNVILDERLALGFSETTEWNTVIVPVSGGEETRNGRWSLPRRSYELPYAPLPIADAQAIVAMFNNARGQWRTWLLRSRLDCKAVAEIAGTGDGSTVAFPARKTYGTIYPYYRYPTHIKSGTLTATDNGTAAPITSEANGLVTLTSAPAAGHIVRLTYEFYVPVRFATDAIKVSPVIPAGDRAETQYALISDLTAIEVR